MAQSENDSPPAVSYLIEHSHGTCEVWIKPAEAMGVSVYEPLRLVRVSGMVRVLLRTEVISEAISLDEWMANNFCVFKEGRTSYQDGGGELPTSD